MQYLNFADLRAKLGGRSRAAIYNDLQAGRLPKPVKLGGRLYWDEAALEQHLAGMAEREPSLPSFKGRD